MSAHQSTDQDFEKRPFSEPVDHLVSAQKDANDDLPTPVSAQAPRQKPKVSAATIIPVWIVLSSAVILYNNHLYSTLNFRYPVFLVTWHLTFAVSPIAQYPPTCLTCNRPLAPAFYSAQPTSWMEQKKFISPRICLSALSSPSASFSAGA